MDTFSQLFEYKDGLDLTTEQQEVVKEVKKGASVQVNSVAGSGKTTTLKETFPVIKNHFLALAFNVKIRDDLSKIMPNNGTAMTINGLGHRMWSSQLGKNVVPAGDKLYKLCKDNGVPSRDRETVVKLVNAAKNIGLTLMDDERADPVLTETYDLWCNLTEDMVTDRHIQYARDLLLSSINTALKGWIDFTDQVYMPVVYGRQTVSFDTVLVDEAQDLSPLNHHMLRKVLSRDGQLVSVGDRYQSIYAFRGADAHSMDNLKAMFGLKDMAITYSFRCGEEIVKEARKIVPQIKAYKTNPKGEVFYHENFFYNNVADGAAFLARTNAEVVSIALEILRRGQKVNVIGKEIGKNLITFVKSICPDNCGIDTVVDRLKDWYSAESSKARILKQEDKLSELDDKVQSVLILSDTVSDRDELLNRIKEVFKSSKKGVTVSTIHRAKGLEWRYVYLVNPNFVGKFGKTPTQKQQELNLKYVGITRAINELHYVYI